MVSRREVLVATACTAVANATLVHAQQSKASPTKVIVDDEGTTHVPAYAIPLSSYMSHGAQRAYIAQSLHPPPVDSSSDIVRLREAIDRALHVPLAERAKINYPVEITERRIAGVHVYSVKPAGGVPQRSRSRVLINLHGGGIASGSGPIQLVESIPIAGAAHIEVISVDYRLAPEHKFPAPIEDTAAVYSELLKDYEPRNIGIYGHSVGGMLPAMCLAWFQMHGLPRPGAIAMLSATDAICSGDSRWLASPLFAHMGGNSPPPPPSPNPPQGLWAPGYGYFDQVDMTSPIVSPMRHLEVIKQFPPALLATGTRDVMASCVFYAHRQFVRAGVDAALHVWDGMWHGSIMDSDIPESKEVFEVTARFFDTHLGRS